MASQEGHLDVVRLLLVHGAKVNIRNEDGETAIHLAVYYAHLDVAHVLLENDADPQIKNKKGETPMTLKSKDGKTLLELALERDDHGLARILMPAAPSGELEVQVEGSVEARQAREHVKRVVAIGI
jgi:ankyrin repeat protein